MLLSDAEGDRWTHAAFNAEQASPQYLMHTSTLAQGEAFEDLGLRIKGIPADGSLKDTVAANETARFLGRSSFRGRRRWSLRCARGAQHRFNLLTDKGLVYDGLFIPGDPPGVTLVGRTMLACPVKASSR